MSRLSEFELIAQLFAPLAKNAPGAFGLKDDAAVIAPPPGHDLVVTTDAVVEGVHFLPSDPASMIAKKALRVNLSDLAAKGAEPLGYLLALSLPGNRDREWLAQFVSGLADDQHIFGIDLLGGDTTSTPGPLMLAITAFGAVPTGQMIRRAGAKPRDHVFVSGTIGDAGAGLHILKGQGPNDPHTEFLVDRYRIPQPRTKLGRTLRGIASGALDVSDGLLADLGHIAEVSGVRIEIDASRVPLSRAARAFYGSTTTSVVNAAISGDDYEIAFTVPPEKIVAAHAAALASGTAITEIGSVVTGQGAHLLDAQSNEIVTPHQGYRHF